MSSGGRKWVAKGGNSPPAAGPPAAGPPAAGPPAAGPPAAGPPAERATPPRPPVGRATPPRPPAGQKWAPKASSSAPAAGEISPQPGGAAPPPPQAASTPPSPPARQAATTTPPSAARSKWLPRGVRLPKPPVSTAAADDLEHRFLMFLKKCIEPKQKIIVDFIQLLNEDRDLAFEACHGERSSTNCWVTQAVNTFMQNENAQVYFHSMPDTVVNAEDMLKSALRMKEMTRFRGKSVKKIQLATLHGCTCFDVILCALLDRLDMGHSWRGKLTLDDFVFIEEAGKLRVVVVKNPETENASSDDKVLDVRGLWPIMEEYYTSDGEMPLYFKELKDDLVTTTAQEVTQKWFFLYLRYYPAFASSMARRNFVNEAYHNVRKFGHLQEYEELMNVPPMEADWRDNVKDHRIFQKVYDHNLPDPEAKEGASKEQRSQTGGDNSERGEAGEGLASKSVQEGRGGRCDHIQQCYHMSLEVIEESDQRGEEEEVEKESDQRGEEEEVEKESDQRAEEEEVEKESDQRGEEEEEEEEAEKHQDLNYRQNTTRGLLTFKRHTLQHADHRIRLEKLDDVEYFTAATFSGFLPLFMKRMLKAGKMATSNCKFFEVWSVYKDAKPQREIVKTPA